MWFWVASVALAGSGPWTAGKDRATLFLGVEGQRFGTLGTGSGEDRALTEVGEGVQKLGAKAITSFGLGSRFELELVLPWYRVEATRPDSQLCADLGLGACETTQGVGILETQLKTLLLDEYFGAPFSMALSGELRLGQTTADTRERITNLGEGTIDVTPLLTVGRTGALRDGYWSAWLEGGYRFRTRNTNEYPLAAPADAVAPRDEVVVAAEVLGGPIRSLAVGPSAYFLYRPGLAFGELDLTDPDRFAALAVTAVRVGGTLVVRSGTSPVTFAGSVLGTAYAVNNPTDSWTASVGVQWDGRLGAADE